MENLSRQKIRSSNLIVVKIGTSSLVDESGRLNPQNFKKISSEIADVAVKQKKQVILVTSGAIAAGAERLGLLGNLNTLSEKQAAAAIGQNLLMKEYETAFSAYGLNVAQVLLTRDAIEDRQRYLNSRNTILQILKFGAVPIINENDTVSVEEIKIGDNDNLSALVASLVGADLLIILSDVPGFVKDGHIVPAIEKITKEIKMYAASSSSAFGTGGMMTKFQAAFIARRAGIPMVIGDNKQEGIIASILNGEEIGTLFMPEPEKMESKKRWLAHAKKSSGKIIIDSGAEKALLENGKSLLPVGVSEIKGRFGTGDVVSIMNKNNEEIGRGLTNYNSEDLSKIKGLKTSEVEHVLGTTDEVIHRNNMVII